MAVPHSSKLCSVEYQILISWQFCRSKVWCGLRGIESRCWHAEPLSRGHGGGAFILGSFGLLAELSSFWERIWSRFPCCLDSKGNSQLLEASRVPAPGSFFLPHTHTTPVISSHTVSPDLSLSPLLEARYDITQDGPPAATFRVVVGL